MYETWREATLQRHSVETLNISGCTRCATHLTLFTLFGVFSSREQTRGKNRNSYKKRKSVTQPKQETRGQSGCG